MTDKEKQLAEKYPEASLLVAMAGTVWQGSKAVVKMELDVTGKLKSELQRLLGTFALIPLILNEFDKAEYTDTDKLGNKKILFTKKIDGLVYLATVERGPHRGEVRTFWKML